MRQKCRRPGEGFAALGCESGDLYVWTVFPGSPAEKAGLRDGDIIVSVDGHAVKDPDELMDLFVKKKPGDPVVLAYDKLCRGAAEKLSDELLEGSTLLRLLRSTSNRT